MQDLHLNELESNTPEEVAMTIFNSNPKSPCSYQIIAEQQQSDITYIFEILITILMEGFLILTGDIYDLDFNNLTDEHISSLNPWFKSLGFRVKSSIYTMDEKELCDKYYCNILIKNKQTDVIFEAKKIYKPYHFMLNGYCLKEYKDQLELNKFYAVIKSSNIIHKISFDFYYPVTPKYFNDTNNTFLQTEQY
jgi:hypothetical protein